MADKEAKVEVPPGPLGADAQVEAPSTKAELAEVLVRPEDAKLHPAPGASLPDGVEEANDEPNNPPYSTGRPDQAILSGLATGPGAHTPPDPEEFDAEGRPINPRPSEKK